MATAATLDEIRAELRRFAEVETQGSPLYSHLAGHAAQDDDVAGLLTSAPAEFATPTLLLAAAHRLLAAEPFHELVNYFPSLGGSYGVDVGTWPLFRGFMVERADKVRALVAARTTQTNEVRRAALLYPAVALAASEAGGPIGLLEVGTSAGLLLNMDRYAYRYQTEHGGQVIAVGPAKAAIGLHCALELAPGAVLPSVPKKIAVSARVGLDRAPVDLDDEDAAAWLEACVWADQPERVRLLTTAAGVARKYPPDLVAGDAVDDLAAAAARVPQELPLVVLTSALLMYLSQERVEKFLAVLAELAARRPLWWVNNDGYGPALAAVLPGRDDLLPTAGTTAINVLTLADWPGGAGSSPRVRVLARTAPHGERLIWLA